MGIYSCNQNYEIHNMDEIEEVCQLVAGSYHKVAACYFILILYTWFSCVKKINQSW